jgi:transcriptional regulator with XRE-family HTH domain
MKTLGATIKEYRRLMKLTLRQVEDAAGISNAYLSQLENDKIKKPSADVLYKLSCLYCVNIEVFLYAAGIIKDKPLTNSNLLKDIAKAAQLTPEEEEQMIQFLNFLRNK